MSNLVSFGYGLPRSGNVVAGGMGLADGVPSGFMSASLYGFSTLSALADALVTLPDRDRGVFPPVPPLRVLQGALSNSSRVYGPLSRRPR